MPEHLPPVVVILLQSLPPFVFVNVRSCRPRRAVEADVLAGLAEKCVDARRRLSLGRTRVEGRDITEERLETKRRCARRVGSSARENCAPTRSASIRSARPRFCFCCKNGANDCQGCDRTAGLLAALAASS